MAKLEQMLSELQSAGEVDAEGGFTLDRDKAREKMRQFQLSDPHRYVLLLVQAATFKGATSIDFQIDADDMRLRFDGEAFTKEDLDELYTSMFADRRKLALRARHELALAMNAALALNPRFIRLQSSDGRQGVRAHMRPGQDDEIEELTADPGAPGTTIHVKDRVRPGLVLQFVKYLQGDLVEENILRANCRWSQVPVRLDGVKISQGPHLDPRTWIRLPVNTDAVRGEVGFGPDDGPATLRILNAGVSLVEQVVMHWPRGFVALVDGTDLRKDVSMSDVVQDEAYESMMEVLDGAVEHALIWLCQGISGELAPSTYGGPTLEGRGTVGGPFGQSGSTLARTPWLQAMFRAELARMGPLGEHGAAIEGEARQRMCELPLWRTAGARRFRPAGCTRRTKKSPC